MKLLAFSVALSSVGWTGLCTLAAYMSTTGWIETGHVLAALIPASGSIVFSTRTWRNLPRVNRSRLGLFICLAIAALPVLLLLLMALSQRLTFSMT